MGISTSIAKSLLSYLTCVDSLPQEKNFDGVYILGGSQESLTAKYKTLASLYDQERFTEIIILSRPGITEYSRDLGRNLTNDEWSSMLLESYGVPKRYVHTLEIESGFFGTYSEAKGVSKMAEQRNWNSLLLITSPHHTKRARKSFEYFMNETTADIKIAAPEMQIGLFGLLAELFKLKFYQFFLFT